VMVLNFHKIGFGASPKSEMYITKTFFLTTIINHFLNLILFFFFFFIFFPLLLMIFGRPKKVSKFRWKPLLFIDLIFFSFCSILSYENYFYSTRNSINSASFGFWNTIFTSWYLATSGVLNSALDSLNKNSFGTQYRSFLTVFSSKRFCLSTSIRTFSIVLHSLISLYALTGPISKLLNHKLTTLLNIVPV